MTASIFLALKKLLKSRLFSPVVFPVNNKNTYSEVDKFVLSDFKTEERILLDNKIDLIDKNIMFVFNEDINSFMNEINK